MHVRYSSCCGWHRETDREAAFISILSAIMITMIGLGIEQPDPVVQATVKTGFASAFASVTKIIFAYAGHVAFFSFISELKNPNDFTKALFFCKSGTRRCTSSSPLWCIDTPGQTFPPRHSVRHIL